MAATADRELSLGTIFTGRVDATFNQAVARLRTAITGLTNMQAQIQAAAKASKVKGMSLGTELTAYQKTTGKLSGETQKLQTAFASLASLTDKYKTGLSTLEGSLMKVERAIHAKGLRMEMTGRNGRAYIENVNRIPLLHAVMTNSLRATSTGFERVSKGMSDSEKAAAKAERAQSRLTAQAERAQKANVAQHRSYGEVGRQIGRVSDGVERLTRAFRVIAAYGMAGTFTYGLINGLRNGVKAIFDFDQGLKNLQAITTATDAETALLGETIKDVASRTKYSATEVSNAATILGQAGLSAEESIQTINATAMLATGTLSDMTTSADLLTTAIRAFQLDASRSGEIADYFANAINKSKLTVDKLRIAFNYIAPVAHSAGVSLQETVAATMILGNAGVRASTIGTGLRQILSRLVAPSAKLREQFAALGMDISKLNPKANEFRDIIGYLQKGITNAGDAFRLFGLRGAPAVAAITAAGVEGFDEMLNYVNRMGAAEEMAAKQMEGLGVISKNLKDRLQVLAITIGEGGLTLGFKTLLVALREVVILFTKFAGSTIGSMTIGFVGLTSTLMLLGTAFRYVIIQMAAMAWGVTIARAKEAIKIFGFLHVAVTSAGLALSKIGSAFVAHPFLRIAAVIAALIVGIAALMNHMRKQGVEAEKNAIQNLQVVKNLEIYKERLEKTTEGSAEHSSIVRQLTKDYPQLKAALYEASGAVDLQTAAVEKLLAQYKDVARVNLERSLTLKGDELKKSQKEIGKLEKTIVSLKKESERVPGDQDVILLLQDASAKALDAGEKFENLKFLAAELEVKYFRLTGKRWDWEGAGVPDHVSGSVRALADAYAELNKVWEDMTEAQREQTQQNYIKTMGEDWEKYYATLDSGRKADLAQAVIDTDKKLEKLEKAGKEAMHTQAQMDETARMFKLKTLRDFQKKELEMGREQNALLADEMSTTEREDIHKTRLASLGQEWTQYYSKLSGLRRANFAQAAMDAEEELHKHKFKAQEQILIEAERAARESDIKRKAFAEAVEQDQKYWQTRAALTEKYYRMGMTSTAAFFQSLRDVQDADLFAQEDAYSAQIASRKKFMDLFFKDHDAILKKKEEEQQASYDQQDAEETTAETVRGLMKTIQEFHDKKLANRKEEEEDVEAIATLELDLLKERLISVERLYRQGKVGAKEYYELLEEYTKRASTGEEGLLFLQRKQVEMFKSRSEQFKFGREEAKATAKTWGEVWVEIGENIDSEIANNATNAIMEFATSAENGFKAAGKAAAKFASETLSWLMKIILRQQILNALQGSMPGLFGGKTATATAGFEPGWAGWDLYHGGGTVGKTQVPKRMMPNWMMNLVPKFHLGSNEVPAILKKGEKVIPEGGEGMSSVGKVSIELKNDSGMHLKADQANVRFDMDTMVIGIVLNAADSNMAFRSRFGLKG